MNNNGTLILGSSGFLGSYFQRALGSQAVGHTSGLTNGTKNSPYELISANLESEADVNELLESAKFSKVINCIALSDVDECEKNPQRAAWLNTKLPEIISRKCKIMGSRLIQISTDAVFSGDFPFTSETMIPNPKSVYGLTKAWGETAALRGNPNTIVCRVNFFGWNPRGKSLFNYFYSSLKVNQEVDGFKDLFFTPLYAADTVKIVLTLAKSENSGIFHVVGNEKISKFEFGQLVAKKIGTQTSLVKEGSFLDSHLAQTRTADLSLSNVKIESLGIKIPSISDGIEALMKEVKTYDV